MSTRMSFHSSVGMSDRRRSISASPVETIWMTAAWPCKPDRRRCEAIRVGVFIEVRRWPKKRCLADSKAERAADLACRFSVPFSRRDVGGLHRSGEVVVDDGEGPGIGIVDAALLRGQRMFQHLVFDAVIGERPGGVEAERPQVAGKDLHRRNPACLDGLDELRARREGEIFAAPEAEPLRIGEVVN
jgi:hypothetical protein